MNQPVTPAMTATIVPASSALTMNGYEKSCRTSDTRFQDSPWKIEASGMAVAVDERSLRLPDHDEPAVTRAQHLDRRAEQPRQRLAGDHVLRAPCENMAACQVHDPVEVRQDRVD